MTESATATRRWCKRIVGIVLPLVIIGLGVFGAKYFLDTRPTPKKKPLVTMAPLVTVQPASFGREQVVIQAMGTVIPAQKTALSPQVSGRIVDLAAGFEPGGILARGTTVVKIDPRDFTLSVRQKHASLVQARAALALEQGQQDVARKEWELLRGDQGMDPEEAALALRTPQLEQARADVEQARLDLEQAELDLARTSVTAPFNGLVLEKNVDLGSQVSPQTTLATLVGTDVFWVETSIPTDRLAWLAVPRGGSGPGSLAHIRSSGRQQERTGRVIRVLGDIEAQGRMARVLVRVDDPLGLIQPNPSCKPLLLGEYVHVDIEGRVLEDVVALSRDALRDGNRVWIATPEDTLDIRPVDVAWRDAHMVYLGGGIAAGEKIILSDISTPIQGMEVRIADKKNHPDQETMKGSSTRS
jgi:RND family efflux transporter MFP subunit